MTMNQKVTTHSNKIISNGFNFCLYRQLSDDAQWIVRELLLLITLNPRENQNVLLFKFSWRHPIVAVLSDVREICLDTLLFKYRRKISQYL